MSSRDFSFLTLRNFTAYNNNNTPVANNYVLTVSSNGENKWTNNLVLNSVSASSISVSSNINVSSIVVSVIQPSTIIDNNGSSGLTGQILSAGAGNSLLWTDAGGAGFVTGVNSGNNITVNNTNPAQPIINLNSILLLSSIDNTSTITTSTLSSINSNTGILKSLSILVSSIKPSTIIDKNGSSGGVGQVLGASAAGNSLEWTTVSGGTITGINSGNSNIVINNSNPAIPVITLNSSLITSSLVVSSISTATIYNSLTVTAGNNDIEGLQMATFSRHASSGITITDYLVTSDSTGFPGGTAWQDRRLIYNSVSNYPVWAINTSTTASNVGGTVGSIRFYQSTFVDGIENVNTIVASTIYPSSINVSASVGTANQFLSINSAGNGMEWRGPIAYGTFWLNNDVTLSGLYVPIALDATASQLSPVGMSLNGGAITLTKAGKYKVSIVGYISNDLGAALVLMRLVIDTGTYDYITATNTPGADVKAPIVMDVVIQTSAPNKDIYIEAAVGSEPFGSVTKFTSLTPGNYNRLSVTITQIGF